MAQEVKFTPGPWCVQDPMGADIGLWIVQSGLEAHQWSCIAMVTDDEDGDARDEGGRFIGRTEQEANARLIAAAPELLDCAMNGWRMCQAMILAAEQSGKPLPSDHYAVRDLPKFEAAIAKAGGRP